MTDDPTKDLTDSEKLNRILDELVDLKAWRAKVDAAQEERTKETRPKLDLIIKEISDLREEMAEVRKKLMGLPRLERGTYCLGGSRSIHLSYKP